jgi:hypothetical protein
MPNASFLAKRGQGIGYNRVILDGKVIEEIDTFQCAHCNATIFIKPSDPSPWCSCCDRQWCGRPRCRECTPFIKKIELYEAIDRAKRLLWQEADNV